MTRFMYFGVETEAYIFFLLQMNKSKRHNINPTFSNTTNTFFVVFDNNLINNMNDNN